MIALAGADIVRPDGVRLSSTLVISNGRIAEIRADAPVRLAGTTVLALRGHLIVPGFIDVHVHGVDGADTLDADDPVARIASALPRYGVTAFCPTTVACAPEALRHVLDQVRRARTQPNPDAARVLPAHLESNFINPDYRGAQPLACLRRCEHLVPGGPAAAPAPEAPAFTAQDVLREIDRATPEIAMVTLAPEMNGGLELIRWLVERGIRVSLGHSAATFEQGIAAIAAGARHATHLFNRMPPLHHREPGLAGAVLQSDDVAAEIICDGVHVHVALVRAAVAAKGLSRIIAITDGTAASGLADGARAQLGGRRIAASGGVARLDDGTMAGSVLTMDAAFRMLTAGMGFSPIDAARMCSTTPAHELGLVGHGEIAEGAVADLVVLDGGGQVVQTWVSGRLVYARQGDPVNERQAGSV